MKTLKKLLSTLLASAMTVSCFASAVMAEGTTPVYTEDFESYAYGWNYDYAGATQTDEVFMCVTDEMAKDGNYSMLISNPVVNDPATDGDERKPTRIFQSGIATPAGTYTFSVWFAGKTTNYGTMIYFSNAKTKQYNKLGMTQGETVGDWTNYTCEFVVENDSVNGILQIMQQGSSDGTYIDNVSLTDASGNEYVVNGSFDYEAPDYSEYGYGWSMNYSTATESNDVTMYVTDEKAKSGDYSMFIKNTITEGAVPINISQTGFNAGPGEYKFSFWLSGVYTGWRTMVSFTGDTPHLQCNLGECTLVETVGEWKKYEYTFVVPEGCTKNTISIMRQGNSAGMFIDDVSLTDADGNEMLMNGSFDYRGPEYTPENDAYASGWTYDYNGATQSDDVFMCVTDDIAKSGNRSMLIYNNVPSADAKATRIIQKNLNATAGEYTLSFWIAGDYSGWRSMILFDGGSKKQLGVADCTKGVTIGRWTNYTHTFTVAEGEVNTALYLMREGVSTGVFLDDISLKDAEGNELIENGGFEDNGAVEYTSAYEEYLNGWTVGYDDGTQSDDVFVCVTDDKANNGNHSVLIRNTIANKEGAPAIGISQSGFQAPAGDYKFSFWISGEYPTGWKTMVSLAGEKHLQCNLEGCTLVDTAGRWSKYEYTFTVPEGCTNNTINILREGDSAGMYIDDISLTDANGNELIANGGFEIKGNLDELINPVAYPTSEGNAITLSWKNPPKAYDEIKIYFDGELQTGVEVEEISTAANAFNQFYYSGIENYTEYTVKVEALRGGEIVSSVELPVWTDDLGPTTNYAGNQPIDPWKYTRMENTEYGYANTVASVDYEEKASGSSSMKLTGNIEKVKHQCYPNINQQVTLDQGVKYVLSFKAKLNNVGALFVVLETEDLGEKIWGRTQLLNNFTTSDWKTYTVPLVFENENGDTTFDSMNEGEMYSATIMIAVEKMIGSINIDDVKLYAVEEDDDTYTPINAGENLIKNGGFEFGGYAVEDAKFEVSNGSKFVAIDKIQSGDIKVTTGIRNISMGEDFGAATIIAVYNNGQLVSIPYILEREYVESSVYLPTDKYSAIVTIPEMTQDDKYEIKVMYWDGFSAMKSLDTADCLK